MKKNNIIISLDLGEASVGWAVVDAVTYKVLESGVNIFSRDNPRNNYNRKVKRQSRRKHRRKKSRVKAFNKLWKNQLRMCSITLDDKKIEIARKKQKIIEIRNKGIREKLNLQEIYLVLVYMLKHRGFISSGTSLADNDLKNTSDKIEASDRGIPCEIQLNRLKNDGRYRGHWVDSNGKNNSNIFTIEQYIEELNIFFKIQKEFYPSFLEEEFIQKYYEIFFPKKKCDNDLEHQKSRNNDGIKDENNSNRFKGKENVPVNIATDDIHNPVVKCSVSIAIKVVNALIKKYKDHPQKILIERTDFENIYTEELDKILEEINIEKDIQNDKDLLLYIKLWHEQDKKCIYTGKNIELSQILNKKEREQELHKDHIIPRIYSGIDSSVNRALTFSSVNEYKASLTPYLYLTKQGVDKWNAFCSRVNNLYIKGLISEEKKYNLLYEGTLDDLYKNKDFNNRSIMDTIYITSSVYGILQEFFHINGKNTEVEMIPGYIAYSMRRKFKLPTGLDKRDTYIHHAEDAILMCFDQIKKESTECDSDVDHKMKKEFDEAIKSVKYWHKVDKKANRKISRDTIRGTRCYEDGCYIIKKLDIRTQEGYKTFKRKIESGRCDDFLMKKYDPKTFDFLCDIIKDEKYCNKANPFLAYENDTKKCITKCSKNENAPKIRFLKYKANKVGSVIDVSHKYGHRKDSKKVVLERRESYRTDVYYSEDKNGNTKYYLVGIKYSDFKFEKGKYQISKDTYDDIKKSEGVPMNDDIKFLFSLYKNDIIKYKMKDDETVFTERFLSRVKNKNKIETKPIERAHYEKQKRVQMSNATLIEKIYVDILGNAVVHPHQAEEPLLSIDNV